MSEDALIVWEDPPATARRPHAKPGRYDKFAKALRDNPGKWAVLPHERTEKTAQGFSQNLRRGKVKGFENAEWETAIEGSKIWVRFLKDKPVEEPKAEEPKGDDDTVPETATGPYIRAWGKENGWPDLPDRGRLPRALVEAYHARTPAPGLQVVPHTAPATLLER